MIGNKDSVLHDIYEILKPGGKFIITDIYLKTCYSGNNEAEKQDIIRASDKKPPPLVQSRAIHHIPIA